MPFIEDTASSEAEVERLDGVLHRHPARRVGHRQRQGVPKDILGERAVEFALNEARDTTMRWSIMLPHRSYGIVVDESQAAKLPWPRLCTIRLHRQQTIRIDRL